MIKSRYHVRHENTRYQAFRTEKQAINIPYKYFLYIPTKHSVDIIEPTFMYLHPFVTHSIQNYTLICIHPKGYYNTLFDIYLINALNNKAR